MKKWKIIEAEKYDERIRALTWAIVYANLYLICFETEKDETLKTDYARMFTDAMEAIRDYSRESYRIMAESVHKPRIPVVKKWLEEHPAK